MMGSRILALTACALLSMGSRAQMPERQLPAARLVASFAQDDLLGALKQSALLSKLSKDDPGCPIVLRVTHSLVPTSSNMAAGLASAALAGGTLGLLPLVTNRDLVITYELIVNGTQLASYAYQENFTNATNIYSQDKTEGLGAKGRAWALSTVARFNADAEKDPKVASVIDEYRLYFGADVAP